jgi:hypothetical protein
VSAQLRPGLDGLDREVGRSPAGKRRHPELSTALILGATLLLRWLKKHTRLLNAEGR